MVRDLDLMLKNLKAGGATVIAADGQAVTIGNGKIVLVRDPNNLILELIEW